jgi:hypothetical protein
MPNHLQSKSMAGLAAILLIAVLAAIFHLLTAELVDVLKWVGGSFMAMRAVANYSEGKSPGA